MAIELFAHNQKAYESALQMLEDEHKTAVIHPTGTGKSFIGFQFVDEHPDWKICWISGSLQTAEASSTLSKTQGKSAAYRAG